MNQNAMHSTSASNKTGVEFVSRRNCSIGPQALIGVFASLSLLSFGFGVAFAAHGPWLILPFAGIETLVVGVAFFACARHAGDYERILVRPDAVTVEQVAGGSRTVREFNPRWAKLTIARRPLGVTVALSQSGEQAEVGRHLGFERRLAFAAELDAAFRRAARA